MRRNPTLAEEYISELLYNCKLKFVTQQCFYNMLTGDCYIADFWLKKYKVVIECDGRQHYTHSGTRKDKIRDERFMKAGIRTIRLPNWAVFSLNKTKLLSLVVDMP